MIIYLVFIVLCRYTCVFRAEIEIYSLYSLVLLKVFVDFCLIIAGNQSIMYY